MTDRRWLHAPSQPEPSGFESPTRVGDRSFVAHQELERRPLVTQGGRSDQPVGSPVRTTWLRQLGRMQGGEEIVLRGGPE